MFVWSVLGFTCVCVKLIVEGEAFKAYKKVKTSAKGNGAWPRRATTGGPILFQKKKRKKPPGQEKSHNLNFVNFILLLIFYLRLEFAPDQAKHNNRVKQCLLGLYIGLGRIQPDVPVFKHTGLSSIFYSIILNAVFVLSCKALRCKQNRLTRRLNNYESA